MKHKQNQDKGSSGMLWGMFIGALIFAVTQNVIYIGMGMMFGLLFGSAYDARTKKKKEDGDGESR